MITRQGKFSYLRKRIPPILHCCRKVRALLSTDAGVMGVDARKTQLVIITSVTSTTTGFQQEVLSNICSLVLRLKHKQVMIWVALAQLKILLNMGRAGRGGSQETACSFTWKTNGCHRRCVPFSRWTVEAARERHSLKFSPCRTLTVRYLLYLFKASDIVPLLSCVSHWGGEGWVQWGLPGPGSLRLLQVQVNLNLRGFRS